MSSAAVATMIAAVAPCKPRAVATADVAFALGHPAPYEAMFVLPADLRFAVAETRPELRAAFEAMAAVPGQPAPTWMP